MNNTYKIDNKNYSNTFFKKCLKHKLLFDNSFLVARSVLAKEQILQKSGKKLTVQAFHVGKPPEVPEVSSFFYITLTICYYDLCK